MVLLTQMRKYRCADCGCTFRAPDRRIVPRESNAFVAERLPEACADGMDANGEQV
jgi:hypothetical protein